MSLPVSSPEVEPTVARAVPADERIPFDLAATALNVSRRTVERMVSDGRLDRDTTATDADRVSRVTRRSLVAVLGERRDTEANAARDAAVVSAASDVASGLDVGRLVADLVDARAEAAVMGERVRLLEAGATEVQRRDDLLGALVAGSWRERRQARRDALAALIADRAADSA